MKTSLGADPIPQQFRRQALHFPEDELESLEGSIAQIIERHPSTDCEQHSLEPVITAADRAKQIAPTKIKSRHMPARVNLYIPCLSECIKEKEVKPRRKPAVRLCVANNPTGKPDLDQSTPIHRA